MKLDKDWTGTSSSFLNHWGDQIINLNLYKQPNDQTTTSVKLEWIKSAVKDHPALAAGINAHEANIHTMKATFHNPATHPELYDEEAQWAQIMTRLATIATEYDANFKQVKKTQRAVNNAATRGGGSGGRGGGRDGRGRGRGGGRTSTFTPIGWIEPEKWQKMSATEQQQAKRLGAKICRLYLRP